MYTSIKLADVEKRLKAGHIGFIAEYRGMSCGEIPYVSKKTGRQMIMKKASHAVEVNGQPVVIGEILKDDVDISKHPQPQVKGKMVLVDLKAMQSENGTISARGLISPIEG
jgi:hypothetical protein